MFLFDQAFFGPGANFIVFQQLILIWPRATNFNVFFFGKSLISKIILVWGLQTLVTMQALLAYANLKPISKINRFQQSYVIADRILTRGRAFSSLQASIAQYSS